MLKESVSWLDADHDMPVVRLLPRYDSYLLGYADRAFLVADAYAKRVHPGGGLIRSTVIVDGQAIANWQLKRTRSGVTIIVEPFEPLPTDLIPLIESEVRDVGRFLQQDATLQISEPPDS